MTNPNPTAGNRRKGREGHRGMLSREPDGAQERAEKRTHEGAHRAKARPMEVRLTKESRSSSEARPMSGRSIHREGRKTHKD
jgi:hypothetical protein